MLKWRVTATLAVGGALAACGTELEIEPDFPADISGFTEVRDCRKSSDHDLDFIRVLVDDAAREPYVGRTLDFPVGAVVLKPQYEFADTDCSGEVVEWTVMRRVADGPALQLGWNWQRVGPDRKVISENDARCFQCHADCSAPPFYLNTCAEP